MKTTRLKLRELLAPLERFVRIEAAGGILLAAATVLALQWANSPWSPLYQRLWELTPVALGTLIPEATLRFWVNDGLMTIFFLVVGLEIRRELHAGALADRRTAALPLIAAIGGMCAPALLYLMLAHDATLLRGWAIPTATDIAFAVGALMLLGRRAAPGLRALLLGLAIIDDIGAVLLIACFYAQPILWASLGVAAAAAAVLWVLRAAPASLAPLRLITGAVLWIALLRAGVHPSITGVIVGLIVPVHVPHGRMAGAATPARSPAQALQDRLHPWVAFGVMPLFALANAGIDLRGLDLHAGATRVLIGAIVVALTLGKPLGIVLAMLAGVRLKLCRLPPATTPAAVIVVGLLGGIGFTMSIFIATLAFPDAALLAAAKLGVLLASILAALGGLALGALLGRRPSGHSTA